MEPRDPNPHPNNPQPQSFQGSDSRQTGDNAGNTFIDHTDRNHWSYIDWDNRNPPQPRSHPIAFASFGNSYGISTENLISLLGNPHFGREEQPKTGLKREMVKKIKKMKMGTSGQDCSVCFTKFQTGEKIRKLPCKHIFHSDCLMPWLKQNNTCPNCRFNLEDYFKKNPNGEYS